VHEVLVYLTISGEDLTTTPEHPFLRTDGQWTPAGELAVGNEIRRADGEYGTVETIQFAATPQVMYNMTVADAHTYTVGDGEWVVHNACDAIYGNLDKFSRPTGIIAELSAPLPSGTKANPRILPPGWGTVYNGKARGHLLANVLGGSGDDKRNLVTIVQIPINTPIMRDIELSIRDAVNAGETILYQVTPIYRGGDLIPMGITIEAIGDQGFELALTLLNRFR
jgi:hypothetical protein